MNSAIQFTKGTRVRHINKPEWGVGQLLEDGNSQSIRIFFEQKGEREILSSASVKLMVLTGPAAQSTLLDNLHLPGPGSSRPMVTMGEAKLRFLELYPGGLQGEKIKLRERNYKDELSKQAHEWYAAPSLQAALEEGRHADILNLAHQLVKHAQNNLPATFEKMAFNDAVKSHTRPCEFAEAFCAWVLPAQPSQLAFEAFAKELDHMGCAKWPILTAYRFLLHPDVDVLIKPTNLANAAAVARFEINYRSDLSWQTYSAVMAFYRYIREQIADLEPTDMIDVQNFIWCIDPAFGGHD